MLEIVQSEAPPHFLSVAPKRESGALSNKPAAASLQSEEAHTRVTAARERMLNAETTSISRTLALEPTHIHIDTSSPLPQHGQVARL